MTPFDRLHDSLYEPGCSSAEMIRQYVGSGVNIKATDSRTGDSLMHFAAGMRDTGMITYLLNNGAEINQRNTGGWTPLHVATDIDVDGSIQHDLPVTFETARLLIALGADELVTDAEGRTPRDFAAAYGLKTLVLYENLASKRTWTPDSTTESARRVDTPPERDPPDASYRVEHDERKVIW